MQRAGANTTTIGMHKGSASLVTACIGCRIQIHNCCRGLSSRASTGIEGHETGRAATGGLVEEGGHPAREILFTGERLGNSTAPWRGKPYGLYS